MAGAPTPDVPIPPGDDMAMVQLHGRGLLTASGEDKTTILVSTSDTGGGAGILHTLLQPFATHKVSKGAANADLWVRCGKPNGGQRCCTMLPNAGPEYIGNWWLPRGRNLMAVLLNITKVGVFSALPTQSCGF